MSLFRKITNAIRWIMGSRFEPVPEKPTATWASLGLSEKAVEAYGEAARQGIKLPEVAYLHLPAKFDQKSRQLLEKLGWSFDGLVGDRTEQLVVLPIGWKSLHIPTTNPIDVVMDAKGRDRVTIRHKFSDAVVHCRFSWYGDIDNDDPDCYTVEIIDRSPTSITIHSFTHKIDELAAAGESAGKVAAKLAEAWLDQNHPGWRDPTALWD